MIYDKCRKNIDNCHKESYLRGVKKNKTTSPKPYKTPKEVKVVQEPAVALSKKRTKLKVLKNNLVHSSKTDDASILKLVEASRAGIKYGVFEKISESSSFTLDEWSQYLHLSTRSMLRYKKDKKGFDPIQSEKILQIAILYQKGSEVFGSTDSFDRWLSSSVVTLGGLVPKSLLDNSFGIRLITDQLGRIEHGVLA